MRTLIENGTIVSADGAVREDVWIEGETVVAVADATRRSAFPAERVIDATDRYVIPGGIDVHTHLDMPVGGLASRDDFSTGTIAAAHGGTTSIIDFVGHERGHSLHAALETWHQKAQERAVIDYGFHMTVAEVTPATLEEMAAIVDAGVTSFKLFTAYADRLFSEDGQILRALQRARELGALTMLHAENGPVIEVLVAQALARGERTPVVHALTRPEATETEATYRGLCLAELADAPLYIVHLSAARALEEVARGRARGLPVYAETCPQYLCCSLDDLARPGFEGAKYVCSPPLRTRTSQEALWRGLAEGSLHVVATDHCPFDYAGQKDLGREDFSKIPNGLPAIETRLHLLWDEGVSRGRISLSRFVELTATMPARLFGLYPRKGVVMAGADADLVIWDPAREQSLSCRDLHMRVDYSPYEGRVVKGAPSHVLSRGEIIVEEGRFLGRPGAGRFLPRATFTAP
jgi:dihydropyrimidinase